MSAIRVELLIGRTVLDAHGIRVGRIEEVRGESHDDAFVVDAFLVGWSPLIARLGAWKLVRPIRGMFPPVLYEMYRVPWDAMDLSDPAHPSATLAKRELRRVPP